ncbi:MAG TPA: DUF433 domain-containing protein [Verrucomicrobiae bacterium]|nr:DUF433 domain-containing protein [Verrucomicrobiae bacterium]
MNSVAEIKSIAGGLVLSNPGIFGGAPVFSGTRLPVQTLRGRKLAILELWTNHRPTLERHWSHIR